MKRACLLLSLFALPLLIISPACREEIAEPGDWALVVASSCPECCLGESDLFAWRGAGDPDGDVVALAPPPSDTPYVLTGGATDFPAITESKRRVKVGGYNFDFYPPGGAATGVVDGPLNHNGRWSVAYAGGKTTLKANVGTNPAQTGDFDVTFVIDDMTGAFDVAGTYKGATFMSSGTVEAQGKSRKLCFTRTADGKTFKIELSYTLP